MFWNSVHRGLLLGLLATTSTVAGASPQAFGPEFPKLESKATGAWWEIKDNSLLVPRDQVVAFGLYTHDRGILKLTAQLFPLLADEPRSVRLEFWEQDRWREAATAEVNELGWSAHFRIEPWDNRRDVRYRLRHGESAIFAGLIRHDPSEKEVIVVGNLSCNSSRTPGPRATLVENLRKLDPDLLFFAGDQSYYHTEHTFGWLEWGMQFREVLRDRPVVTIPDDHDIGQANLWGENGIQATTPAGPSGGYYFPAKYVNMVQRCQTWHLPDPFDPTPIEQGIGVYYTRLRLGQIDFAILEDRKFKSGPEGKIPQQGPRPDHITADNYDPASIDLPGLELLGQRQLRFLDAWSQDWEGALIKSVLSQTAFAGAVHLHGTRDNRLLADLDCNGWPQRGRKEALRAIRRAWATHLCGDQHLAVVIQHGIDADRDGPYGFTSPAIVNTIYGRWWQPVDNAAGADPVPDSPLAWTGNYQDGLGNRIRMLAYANPADIRDERQRGDGFGIARFDKRKGTVTFECWPRFADVDNGPAAQYPGWPVTVRVRDNDGRVPVGYLPAIEVPGVDRPVLQVVDEKTGETLYSIRAPQLPFAPPVYSPGPFTLRVGRDHPEKSLSGLAPDSPGSKTTLTIRLDD